MLFSAVSVLVVAHSSSEIPEGLMNNSVYRMFCSTDLYKFLLWMLHLTLRLRKFNHFFCIASLAIFSSYCTTFCWLFQASHSAHLTRAVEKYFGLSFWIDPVLFQLCWKWICVVSDWLCTCGRESTNYTRTCMNVFTDNCSRRPKPFEKARERT